jgi:hypothetical protein
VTITHSTVARNFGGGGFGGGILNVGGTMTIANSTIVNNVAGGLSNGGTVTLTNTTVAENGGSIGTAGTGITNGGTMLLQNSIIARNMSSENPFGQTSTPDCLGLIISLGNNLIGDPTGCDITLKSTDLTGDPGLGTFTDNGSPGNGHFPLLSTSQAIDAGNNAVCFRRDQLGRRRVDPCDIGAISFRDKDDRQHEEKDDDHRHDEDTAKAYR